MRRVILAWLVLLAPACTILATAGCEQETKSVQRHERVDETEPQMTSPGKDVVE